MAGPIFKDRVIETTTTTGTGTLTLGGAVTGFQDFSGVGNSNTCHYCVYEVDADGNADGAWEVVLNGTYTTSGTTLTRGTFGSSSTGSVINFGAGDKRIALIEFPAAHANQFCMVHNSALQTIANNSSTAITFDTEIADPAGMHDTGSNTSRITVGVAGLYLIKGTIGWASNATGNTRSVTIRLNGTTIIDVDSSGHPSSSNPNSRTNKPSCLYLLAVGDYVELMAYQDTGGNLNTVFSSGYSPTFSVVRIGP